VTNDSLSKAIAYLGAVEVAPADYGERGTLGTILVKPARYAFQYGSHGRWWSASAATIALWWEKRDPDAGGCPHCVLMPAWWSPQKPETYHCRICGDYFDESLGDTVLPRCGAAPSRITADLETGAEVAA
jgi:hypothetical protein